MSGRAAAFAPATVGNVGPGFDVLGLAVEGLGDRVEVELIDGPDEVAGVSGRDAGLVPAEPSRNAASIAARAMLDRLGETRGARIRIYKGLPLSGGLGGSAASSVAGALAAGLAAGRGAAGLIDLVVEAALAGETAVAGRHLDNIAPCVLGGLTLVRSVDPIDLVRLPVAADWHLALVTPAARVSTRQAREILPALWERDGWVRQMANAAALVSAFASGDAALARRSLVDLYAEPRRAALVPFFAEAKAAALASGALGCSLSGSGPTVFALAEDRIGAEACAAAMQRAFAAAGSSAHVGQIAREGAREA